MKKLTCIYKANPGDGASYKAQAVDGRCRVFVVWSGGSTLTAEGSPAPQIKFYNGSSVSGTDLRLQLTDTMNNGEYAYGSHWCVDLPSDGILFEDGLWIHFANLTYGVTVLVSGGAAS